MSDPNTRKTVLLTMFIGLVVIPLSIALTFVLFLLVGNWFLDPMAGM